MTHNNLVMTEAQAHKLNLMISLRPELQVIPHSYLGVPANDLLVSIGRATALWIHPSGNYSVAGAPDIMCCTGNPTVADCVAAGYCRRDRACNE
jgi:hypothetical protein